ncbi:putative ABC-type dipeptide/oligopeptide/nickel transport systems, permease component [Vibrio nigripulchritudo MADA3029]|uniref:Inner membrane ABC transporter permease protein YejB n=1 Tax=Vibrio nigripulchritudo SOn1 TaxID=1238450 RepID=A0AAV2VTT9_9VIBR|nr:microcin C ABC transporter permease YejB [Vibrio nigripulchritudo]EGU57384.1 putative peptide ABC transporter, permease protein [Vibrio nigripulchritudo ATCC 27043]CCN49944.1 putative ABC-type dipeptide/oligopeptide/nickel transport systems, permease component [Vibrio nigripulchritudo MADA3020]CCN56414.1 putative ABC-type dipeptide/oligopeptide/nickel transport systems, permease component [Vibrio nigripulchritudo MADA3021]CCN62093.1 putative ABC-type dipeptide/oligopeptide/nickel transport s
MTAYIIRRLLLVIPTLWAIITINFFVIQIAPGGPVEQALAQMQGLESGIMERFTGGGQEVAQSLPADDQGSNYRGSRGLDPEVVEEIKKQFGFDKPLHERYFDMLINYATFNFGDSLFKGGNVIDLIIDRLPVSISLGLWSTIIIYLISIPLGILKAIHHGSRFDIWSSAVVIVGYAIPGFLFAILLIILFASGNYFSWFPLRGLVSSNFDQLTWYQQIIDYFWHLALPTLAMVIGGFATLSMLTKNSFLDEINKQYVVTARAKGLDEQSILYKHVFRNAMLIIIAGFPSAFISIFFTGSMLIEVMFSLEGIGLLGFESTIQRDYPVVFSTLYIMTLLGLLLSIISDLTYTWVDPRIDFEAR